MKRAPVRSTLFNILFFGVSLLMCIICLPALVLPRKYFLGLVNFYLRLMGFLERVILGLRYEVRGQEHIPQSGPFLIAAKHQSLYETLKLRLLLNDPAIILKKELLKIPLWGLYLKKSDVIAIDRSTPQTALKSIEDGALRMKAQGRPIVIFPQGTRVKPEDTPERKPYKSGLARIQDATGLPIIPLALNSGLFWPKGGWLKSSGTVIFEFLPPIEPGQHRKDLMKDIESTLEPHTQKLMDEARQPAKDIYKKKLFNLLLGVALLLCTFAAYSYLWIETAKQTKRVYIEQLAAINGPGQIYEPPEVSGYPGPITLHVTHEDLQTSEGLLRIDNLTAKSWPFPGVPIWISTGSLSLESPQWKGPLTFDRAEASLTLSGNLLNIQNGQLRKGDFTALAEGQINLAQEPFPKLDLLITLENYQSLLSHLANIGIIETRIALFMGAGFNALSGEDGRVRVPLTQRGQTLYAGPIPVASLPALPHPERGNPPALD